ncbi:MAG TPA: methyltransferase domain-containing protein [Stellaceae bacterium]|nr:methyltransferase domain-containing protein [Stellaceae bacterium]
MQRPPAAPPSAWHPLGPVTDLERHVRADWWHEIFDDLYLKTDGDVFENPANTRDDVDAVIAGVDLVPNDRILDLCCGQGRHAIELARRGYRRVTGVDLSPYLVDLARRRAAASGVAVTFLEGDARHCRLRDHTFDCVTILGNSFGYFEAAEEDAALLGRARILLRAGGRLALDLVDGDWLRENFEKRSWEWLDGNLLVCRERALSRDGQRLITREMVLDAGRGVVADRFFAERLYSRAAIADLLAAVGFASIGFREATESRSDRAADLGMMARRLLVTARAEAERPPSSVRRPRDVAVILGDPQLGDSVKPQGRFGEADLQTVATLRAALATLPDYRFRFLDDHATLADSLRRAPPDLVLNLCDEGYGNDATMEAHVPALLDMLGIPYSGAGPGCLTLCYDKSVVRGVAAALGIAVPDEIFIAPDQPLTAMSAHFPALIKPCLGDNSVGIDEQSVVAAPEEAQAALRRLRHLVPGRPLLVQEFLAGAEYSVGVIGNPDTRLETLPILEVDYTELDGNLPRILAYASKWDPQSPYARKIAYRKADLPEPVSRRLIDQVTRLFARLGCRDYARFDFRAVTDGEIKLLEVNPNPGWCWDGKLALMASFAGQSYPDLLRRILAAAEARLAASPALDVIAAARPHRGALRRAGR